MTPPSITARDSATLGLGAILLIALLAGVREVLTPPVVFLLLVATLWPIRDRAGIRALLVGAGVLTTLWLLEAYGALLGPFVLALVLAYLLTPAVAAVERRGIRRTSAIALVLVPLVAVVVGLVVLVAPQVADQTTTLADRAPQFATTVLGWLDGLRARLSQFPLLTSGQRAWLTGLDGEQLAQLLQQHTAEILRTLGGWALGLVRQAGTLLGLVGYLVITPVVLYHGIHDWPRLTAFLGGLIPPARREQVHAFVAEYDRSLGRYVRGALIEAVLIGVLTFLGLSIAAVPSALLLGVITGLATLIPYLGVVVAAVLSLVVALTMDDPTAGLLRVAIVFVVVHILDGSVTGPRIVGNSVGIHPVWIMISLALSGAVFGFVGLLLAVPIAVLVKLIGTRLLAAYRASTLFVAPQAD